MNAQSKPRVATRPRPGLTLPAALDLRAACVLPATLLVSAALTLSAVPATAQAAPDLARRVDDVFAAWDSETSPGCAVGVTRYGQPVLERAYGMADLEHRIPNTPETIFEGGSVSKQFTSAAIMQLVLDGELSLEDDVRKHIPEVPDYGTPITLHRLMTHTSGLRDWGSVASISGWGREQRSHDHDDVLDIVSRQSALNFEPGHEYSYSNTGYNLLAVVVSRVSGMPFAEFSNARIFEPLGMTRTQWRDDYRRIVPGRSTAYNATRDGGWEINRPVEYVHGNGGILTTVGDLAIWNRALTDGRGLGGDAFLELMHRQGTLSDGSEIVYAGGLMIDEFEGLRSVTHTGSTAGYRAFVGRYPEQGLGVAMLCNASNVPTGGSGSAVARVFLDEFIHDAPPLDHGRLARPDGDRFAGLYADPVTGDTRTLRFDQGLLLDGRSILDPAGELVFEVTGTERRYVFDADLNGFEIEDWQYTEQRYERVEPWTPTVSELQEYVGEYRSEDAETTYRISVQDGALALWRRPADTWTIDPVYADAFRTRGGVIRFRRDADGGVVALSLSIGRVYDMRFDRVGG